MRLRLAVGVDHIISDKRKHEPSKSLSLSAPYVCQCSASTLAYGANQSSGIGVGRARRAYQIPWQGLHL